MPKSVKTGLPLNVNKALSDIRRKYTSRVIYFNSSLNRQQLYPNRFFNKATVGLMKNILNSIMFYKVKMDK